LGTAVVLRMIGGSSQQARRLGGTHFMKNFSAARNNPT